MYIYIYIIYIYDISYICIYMIYHTYVYIYIYDICKYVYIYMCIIYIYIYHGYNDHGSCTQSPSSYAYNISPLPWRFFLLTVKSWTAHRIGPWVCLISCLKTQWIMMAYGSYMDIILYGSIFPCVFPMNIGVWNFKRDYLGNMKKNIFRHISNKRPVSLLHRNLRCRTKNVDKTWKYS